METVNLVEKFGKFSTHWDPKIVGEVNDSYVKLAKFKGEFVWHHHAEEDEMFLVMRGEMVMGVQGRPDQVVRAGEFIIIPKGVEHKPMAPEECEVMLFERKTVLNTGNTQGEYTQADLERI